MRRNISGVQQEKYHHRTSTADVVKPNKVTKLADIIGAPRTSS
jgi:copper chaperone CopZ